MDSNGPSANSPNTYSSSWIDIVGGAIALATLILPVSIISYYSAPINEGNHQSLGDRQNMNDQQGNAHAQMNITLYSNVPPVKSQH